MRLKTIAGLALWSLGTNPAFAGPGCEYMGGIPNNHTASSQVVMVQNKGYHTPGKRMSNLARARSMHVAHHGGESSQRMESKEEQGGDLVDTAISSDSLTTLVAAIQAADLVKTLRGEGPYTVFAPSDEAFAKLPSGMLENLVADKRVLTRVLAYHVVSGKIMASDLARVYSLNSLDGSRIPVASLQVSKADIETSNGVIHIVDEVLVPKM